ncbi:MAG TPA: hypothetical protein VF401_00530 [Candidatus Saccharimonadales bacterium]
MAVGSEDLKLIALAHGSNVEHVAATYNEMRAALDDRLGGMAVQAAKENEAALVIRNFIGSCIDVLPRYGDIMLPWCNNESRVNVDTQADVRWLQHSAMWIKGSGGLHKAYYLLGESPAGKKTELLLHEPTAKDGAQGLLCAANIKQADYKTQQAAMPHTMKPLTAKEMNDFYNREAEQYTLGYYQDPQGVMVGSWKRNYESLAFEKLPRWISQTPVVAQTENLSSAVYPFHLEKFNVGNRLSYLALAFDKGEELTRVIDTYVTGALTQATDTSN